MSGALAGVPASPSLEEALAQRVLRQARSGQLDENRSLLGQDKRETHADLRGRAHRQPENAPENTAPPAISANTGLGPPSAAKEERRERVLTEFRKARVTGIRVTLPAEALDGKLASLPEGVSVERDRIEVRFNGAKEAVERLYSLAYALVNDYKRFEALVDGKGGEGRGVRMSEALVPVAAATSAVTDRLVCRG